MLKKQYKIAMPIAGVLFLNVTAANKEEAIQEFYRIVEEVPSLFNSEQLEEIEAEVEWDFYEKMCECGGKIKHCDFEQVEVTDLEVTEI